MRKVTLTPASFYFLIASVSMTSAVVSYLVGSDRATIVLWYSATLVNLAMSIIMKEGDNR